MARYFFHLHNGIDAPDEQGTEFDDDNVALDFALFCARDVAAASVKEGHLSLQHFVICVDHTGREVGLIRFADAVKIEG